MTAIQYSIDDSQLLTLTIDMPGQSANTMNASFRQALGDTVAKVLQDAPRLKGIIITSGKKTFFAGGDLNELIAVNPDQAEAFFTLVQDLKRHMRQLETLDIPVVAAINGSALGGGFEICLATHHRIVIDDASIQLGLPEVSLGLLPGGGGVARLVRMLGIEKAFTCLTEGRRYSPKAAQEAGLVDERVATREQLLDSAKAWILSHPKMQQAWDDKHYKLPGGAPDSPKVAQMLAIAPALLKEKTRGCYPAPEAILCAMVEGAQVDFDTACTIESRYFTQLVVGQVAKNMIGTFWFQLNDIKQGASRPDGVAPQRMRRVGVLGAGMMGAGIAYACASRGLEVVLKDISLEQAEKGKAYSEKLLARQVSKQRKTATDKDAILARIKTTASALDLQGCDLIIEAVFEDSKLKAQVTQEAEPQLSAGGIFASNTSTIPITALAEASRNAENFIGLHFFSPVDKMPLVEIIKGRQTSPETLAKAFDFVLQINKTPIVVNDSRGFFTSRVFGTFVNEGIAMLGEGYSPASIENAAQLAGMPVGPLALCDEVSLTLITHIRDQSRKDLEAAGGQWMAHPAEKVIDQMVAEFGRQGRAAGAGFYDYPAGARKSLWSGLYTHFVQAEQVRHTDLQELQDRLLFIQSIETLRCLEEGVLTSVRDANVGSILGIGFAAWTGGAVQFVNQYGVRKFADRATALAQKFGSRFEPPALLRQKAHCDQPIE